MKAMEPLRCRIFLILRDMPGDEGDLAQLTLEPVARA
jgi:hypothetical protein